MIDFIDGASDRIRVIEPLTLQLVCQQAETIAARRDKEGERLMLALADFGGTKGLEQLVQSYFTRELGSSTEPASNGAQRRCSSKGCWTRMASA